MKISELRSQQGVKVVAWTNILVQLAFPVSVTLTPSAAISETHSVISLTDSQLANLPVKPYVLAEGETVSTVAERFQLSIAQLKKLNQLRKYSKPFEGLQTGDEIDIPAELIKDSIAPVMSEDNQFDHKLASGSTTAAGILQSSDIAGSVAAQAKGFAVNQANQEINNWLSGAGTARAKLNIDNKGRVDGSELDLLIPLNDTLSSLTFTQFGLRHIDDRTMANLGIGQRHYPEGEWMFGYNAFFDYDLRRDHSRVGLGLELARDYLKFGANSYFRTSNWRASPDVTDYDERPANGFDLRTEAYIPALPQLGGSLAYEQYYGNEVGLFGKNNRTRNPGALTAGLSYTPFPLLSLGIERKQGTTSGDGDTRFNIGLTYDINGSWSRQVDPDTVKETRTLAGARYDLVERNNEIVLEYRKQEVIRLKVDSLITGESKQTKDLNLSIKAKYGLSSVRWDDTALTAAGGSIMQSGEKYSVTLPPYTEGGVNSWIVSAVAVDMKGNVSNRAETQITVTSAGISLTESIFAFAENTLPADAQSTSSVILKLEDGAGNPVTGLAGDIVLNLEMAGTSGTVPVLSSFKETSPGVYEATMTAGTRTGTLVVTPVVRGISLAPVSIEIVSPVTPSAESLTLSGTLAVGQTLTGSYTYLQPQSAQKSVRNITIPEDKSVYVWGEKGKTESDILSGKTITTSGKIPGYTLQPADAGKIIELSLLPKNSLNLSGKVLTVNTSMSSNEGNEASGGGSDGSIVNPAAEPKVSGLKLSGMLELGQVLSGTYQFDANTGNKDDRSAYAWDEKGKSAASVATTTDVVPSPGNVKPYDITSADVGKVLELSVQARNGASKSGNTLTVDTSMSSNEGNEASGGGSDGSIVNPAAEPKVSGLKLSGMLELGQVLSGTYQFDANTGNKDDRSAYAWDEKGKSAASVATTTDVVPSPGNVKPYDITSADVGKVLELSVQARNGASKSGNTLTVDTSMSSNEGNEASGGGSDGSIVNPAAEPKVSGLKLSGMLELGQVLSGTYQFDANTGNKDDRSAYAWDEKGKSAASVATTTDVVPSPGNVKPYDITSADVGKVLELSVQARNGASKSGNTLTVDTSMSSNEGNEASGGGSDGSIVNPAAEPKVSGLKLSGMLELGQVLSGTYQFDANTGNKDDRSAYAWDEKGKSAASVATTTDVVPSPGNVKPYDITSADVGKVLELSVQARNGASKSGNTLTVDTSMSSNEGNEASGGGSDGSIVNPAAEPKVSGLKLSGMLELGQVLSGTYQFDANTGNKDDRSAYAWDEKGKSAASVATTTDVVPSPGNVKPYDITSADVGKVLELSVQARNGASKSGNTLTVDTSMSSNEGNEASGGGSDGSIVNPAAEPKVSGLKLSGMLELGQVLSGTYQFDANTGNKDDRSAYAWDEKGKSAASVATTTDVVPSPGNVKPYDITSADVGKVLELSVQARNGASKSGNTLTVDTSMSSNEGNEASGGGSDGSIVNPAAEPKVSGLKLSGMLELGQVLSGTYQFDANTGNKDDRSAYAWDEKGKSAASVATTTDVVPSPGNVKPYDITSADVGKVLELSVQARNGASKSGNTLTVDTSMSSNEGNEASGGGSDGSIVNPAAIPEIKYLQIKGSFAVGGKVYGSYQFDSNNGYPEDASLYAWNQPGEGGGGTAVDVTNSKNAIIDEGIVPERDITSADLGKLIELSVLARNSKNVRGTVSTAKSGLSVGMTLQTVPENGDYRSNFKYVVDENGNKMKGLIWPFDPLINNYGVGSYTFRNASPFTTRSTTGIIRVIADDTIEDVVVNGKSYGTPLSSQCKWDKNYCTVGVNNFIAGGNNNISIIANNQGNPEESNPGALNVIVIDLDSNQANGMNILDTTTPSKWTFE